MQEGHRKTNSTLRGWLKRLGRVDAVCAMLWEVRGASKAGAHGIYTYIRTRDFAKLLEPTLPTASLEQVFAYKKPFNLL